MDLIPLKQSFYHSCLVSCLLMVMQNKQGVIDNVKEIEKEIFFNGEMRKNSFYVVDIVKQMNERFIDNVTIIADNKYFASVLSKLINSNKVNIFHEKITKDLVDERVKTVPLICHIDNHYLGDYSHSSHFIVIGKSTDKKYLIIDPVIGKARYVGKEKIIKAINSLRKYVRMCPLIIFL